MIPTRTAIRYQIAKYTLAVLCCLYSLVFLSGLHTPVYAAAPAITGRLLNNHGDPIAYWWVRWRDCVGRDDCPDGSATRHARTDVNGRFTFPSWHSSADLRQTEYDTGLCPLLCSVRQASTTHPNHFGCLENDHIFQAVNIDVSNILTTRSLEAINNNGGTVDIGDLIYILPETTPTTPPSASPVPTAPPTCRIQGFKVMMPGNQPIPSAANRTVYVAGGSPASTASNPFFMTVAGGRFHTVSVTNIAGYSVGSSVCQNATGCHSGPQVSGSSRSIFCPAGGYADLYWHFTPNPPVPPTTTPTGTPTGTLTGVPPTATGVPPTPTVTPNNCASRCANLGYDGGYCSTTTACSAGGTAHPSFSCVAGRSACCCTYTQTPTNTPLPTPMPTSTPTPTFTPTPTPLRPDLVPSTVTRNPPASCDLNPAYTIRYCNHGPGSGGAFTLRVANALGAARDIAAIPVPAANGGCATRTIACSSLGDSFGTFCCNEDSSIVVTVDAGNTVDETNEGNNTSSPTTFSALAGEPFYKVKDASLHRLRPVDIDMPVGIQAYDADDGPAPLTRLNMGAAGIVSSPGGIRVLGGTISTINAQRTQYTDENPYLDSLETFITYANAQRPVKTITGYNHIGSATVNVFTGNLTISGPLASGATGYVLLVNGNVTISQSPTFNTGADNSVALIATGTITIDPSVTTVNAILIANQVELGASTTNRLKINGNLISNTPVSMTRHVPATTTPNLFVVFNPKMYLDLLPYLSEVKLEGRQVQ